MNRFFLKKIFFGAFVLPFFIVSCSNDDDSTSIIEDPTVSTYANGIFVLNEGGSGLSSASVSFITEDETIEQDIFRAVNPDAEEIGTYLQNIFFDETRAFIISGSANAITVVDRYTFEYITTVTTDLNVPRYGAVENGKAYVVNQADWSTGSDDYLTVINLNNYTTSTVLLGAASDHIIKANNKIYVSNGYYGDGNSITVIDPSTDAIETTIDLGAGNSPSTLEEENGIIYVLTDAVIVKINTSDNSISGTITIPAGISSPANLDVESGNIYFTGNSTSVFSLATDDTTISTTPIVTYDSESTYGAMYGFAVRNGKIYIADAGNFTEDSDAYIYSTSGTLLNTFTVGVAPNGFYFNN